MKQPTILVLDIETSPILGWVWGLWENNLSLNQIEKDWEILSFSAKWFQNSKTKEVHGPHNKMIYRDQRHNKKIINDKKLLKELWDLMDQADIILTQNGISFDMKKINAKFLEAGMKPPAPSRQIDTKRLASRTFAFTSNKLEYMTEKFNDKFKKVKNSGFSLWTRCMKGELKAWNEMKNYNEHDILSLEELYNTMMAWDTSINFNVYRDNAQNICSCGSTKFYNKGYRYTNTMRYKRYFCKGCGKSHKGPVEPFTKEKKKEMFK